MQDLIASGLTYSELLAMLRKDLQLDGSTDILPGTLRDVDSHSITVARAFRTAAFSIPAAADTKIPLDTISFDPFNRFDSVTNHRYNVPFDGYYLAAGQVTGQVANNPQQVNAELGKNGALFVRGGVVTVRGGTVGDPLYVTVSDVIKCVAGDYLELWAFNNGANAMALAALSAAGNYLSIVKVG